MLSLGQMGKILLEMLCAVSGCRRFGFGVFLYLFRTERVRCGSLASLMIDSKLSSKFLGNSRQMLVSVRSLMSALFF
jgi:hypothetical protein